MRKSRYLFAMLTAAIGVALLGQAGRAMAGPWDMDTRYGQGGFVAGASWEVVARPDGSLLKLTSRPNGFSLKRFDPDGLQDPQFGSAGQLEITFPPGFEFRGSIPEIDAAGRYLWCGRMDSNGDGVGDLAILRTTAAGIPDPGFGVDGVVSRATNPLPTGATTKYGDWCNSLAIQPDGRIVAGIGHGYLVPGEGSSVRRFNSDGSDDGSFGAGNGRVPVPAYNYPGVQVLPNGWIYVKTFDGYGDYVADNLFGSSGLPGPNPWDGLSRDVYWWETYSSMISGNIFLAGQDGMGKLIIARLSPDGTLDKSFGGAGTGFVTIDPHPSPAVAVNDCCAGGYSARLSQDGQRLYFAYFYYWTDGQVSGEIGRIHVAGLLAGQRDESFGAHGSIPFALPFTGGLWEQTTGDLLVAGDGAVFRLSAKSGRSPGIIGFRSLDVPSRYGNNPTVHVGRYAGDDGAVSISYRTVDTTTDIPRIYEPASGQLQWSDGDSADKSFSVRVLPQVSVTSKGIDLLLESPVGGALTHNSHGRIWVTADAPPVVTAQPIAPTPAPVDPPGYSGGGGATDGLSLLLLLLGTGAAMREPLRSRARSNTN